MNELDLIAWLRQRLRMRPDVIAGPGDDCAILNTSDCALLAATTDSLLEGKHFTASDDPRAVGYKTVAVSLSDLAAMGCSPRWALAGLGLRRGAGEDWVKGFAEGLIGCAEEYGLSLVGGDFTSSDAPTSITLTALGAPFPGGPIYRSGAQAGDLLIVTGSLGGSLSGRHLGFIPRLQESEFLCKNYGGHLHAMIDLSDGLALDLRRVCAESGVGAQVEADSIPVSKEAQELATTDNLSPLAHALSDGEDFELLCALAPESWESLAASWPFTAKLTKLGFFTPASDGLLLVKSSGETCPLPEGGFIHDLS
ncbi:MAG: thiamine-monophosphate kinase [Planctomycetes bacterium]|nr:thiamine-monophosphate kinase [Planctomycetota bacterium]